MEKYKECHKIVKPFKYKTEETWTSQSHGTAALVLDLAEQEIDIDITSGALPMAREVILFALADKDVRRMIKEYQQETKKRDMPFKLRTSYGSSGREDIYINYYTNYGLQLCGKKLLHISQYGKLNEGWKKMGIGDFVELVAYLMAESRANYALNNARRLRRLSGCRYIKGFFDDDATCKVSKIF